MRPLTLNLARRPFTNSRPVFRATILLWTLGALLLVFNAFLYWRHFSGEGQSEKVMRDITGRIEAESAAVTRLGTELGNFDLERQNEYVRFLNEKIAERTFPWSNLFDDLTQVLPGDVQLERVSPRIEGRGRRRSRREELSGEEKVILTLDGRAKDGEEMLGFVDALFAHPSFREPNPKTERREEDSTDLRFSLDVFYLPRRDSASPPAAPSTPTEVAEATEGEPEGEDDPTPPTEGEPEGEDDPAPPTEGGSG